MDNVIKTENLTKVYLMGKVVVPALNGVDVEVKTGEFVSIMGPSGSGKSTLLNLVGMLDTPSSGKIYINGRDVSRLNSNQRAEFRLITIGFVFQSFNLFNELTALENVMLPMMVRGASTKNCKEKASHLLELVGLKDRMNHKPSELSGGQQQRVTIARSLINDPAILLADEPTGNLDTKTSNNIIDMLRDLNQQQGQTIVLVTHEDALGAKADRTIYLRDGKVEGEPNESY